jgi:hypothetical protein
MMTEVVVILDEQWHWSSTGTYLKTNKPQKNGGSSIGQGICQITD